eukprot:3518705-Pyramimonas_sp.AAC.1
MVAPESRGPAATNSGEEVSLHPSNNLVVGLVPGHLEEGPGLAQLGVEGVRDKAAGDHLRARLVKLLLKLGRVVGGGGHVDDSVRHLRNHPCANATRSECGGKTFVGAWRIELLIVDRQSPDRSSNALPNELQPLDKSLEKVDNGQGIHRNKNGA